MPFSDELRTPQLPTIGRREVLGAVGLLALTTAPTRAATPTVRLDLPGGPDLRTLTTAFPQKATMILQRTRPPLLETPFDVFDKSVFTPNNQFFVRWHWAGIPTGLDVNAFRLTVRGHVKRTLSLTLSDLLAAPKMELAAVNQCSGNSRGLFQPRVPGAQWRNGAMGNALWTGVRLRDLLDRAGVLPGAVCVRFTGLDTPVAPGAPTFMKSLAIDHARDGEVMIAYQMNREALPLLNGYPIRLVVPGWFSTYWVKMLSDIEILDKPDDNYWMAKAYRIPNTPNASVKPEETGFETVPIGRMPPRSFFTNLPAGTRARAGQRVSVRGFAFGGDCGVATVEVSSDGGQRWSKATLDRDFGPYSFRRWVTEVVAPSVGKLSLMVRCTNVRGVAQPLVANWNGSGFERNVVERIDIGVA